MSDFSTSPLQQSAAPALFREHELSIGLVMPLLREGQAVPDYAAQLDLAQRADAAGFRALWVRDVPLNSADYPDPIGHLDPWVFLGGLATRTRRAMLVSGAVVLPLRHPLHIAKAAISVQELSGGRFVLGLGSGDRPPEYAAFGQDGNARRELFRQHWAVVGAAVGLPSRVVPDREADDGTAFYLLPRQQRAVPLLAVGSGGQSVDWIARHAIGWMTYHRDPATQRDRHSMWRAACERSAPGRFRAFGVAVRLELSENALEPPTALNLGYRTGAQPLVAILEEMRAAGVHHVALNITNSQRPVEEVLDELAQAVLPVFHGAEDR
ncbi:TIGR03571 family LLM class oxidoreductase [Cupriavidus sp. H18C1]|uniref:TIGR03571 family LLM class oxidoreductase n=1 Tax=Cupriavidus sp. H18C1 TaxID=3241601 RepID=UPI003BB8DDDA